MNGTTLFLVTFLVWISAKGRLPKYVDLIKSRDINGNKDSTPDNTLPKIPNLPQLKSIQKDL